MKEKTVRFKALVKAFGKPEIITFWQDPRMNPGFLDAVQNNQIVTIKQVNVGTKKDFGIVGFYRQRNSTYLRFPKPISYSHGTKVVGINYDLVQNPVPTAPIEITERAAKKFPAYSKPEGASARANRYKVVVRCTASTDIKVVVEARNQREARAKAQEEAQNRRPDLSRIPMSTTVLQVDKQ